MKKTYITHVTRDYLEVALNLAKSVNLFSDLPLIVYCINLQEEDKQKFDEYKISIPFKYTNVILQYKNEDKQ